MGGTIAFSTPAAAYEQLVDEYTRAFQRQGDLSIGDDEARLAGRVANTISEFGDISSDAKLGLVTAAVIWGVQPALRVGLDPEDVSAMVTRDIRLVIERATRGSQGVVSLHDIISSADKNWEELSICKKIWGM